MILHCYSRLLTLYCNKGHMHEVKEGLLVVDEDHVEDLLVEFKKDLYLEDYDMSNTTTVIEESFIIEDEE